MRPWAVASLFATAATPAAVALAWLAPGPLDALVAPPLVALDLWAERAAISSRWVELALFALGVGLTWGLYLLVARLALGRLDR